MRALIALTVLAFLAAAGVAVADTTIPDISQTMQPVEQGVRLVSDSTIQAMRTAGDEAVATSSVFQSQFNAARAAATQSFYDEQRGFASCPAGEGWQTVAMPTTINVINPDAPDVQPYVEVLAAHAQADGSGLAVGQVACLQARLGIVLPALPAPDAPAAPDVPAMPDAPALPAVPAPPL